MSDTTEDRPRVPTWIAEQLDGDRVRFLRRAADDDVQGHGAGFNGLGRSEEDVEGHGGRANWIGQTEEDVEGQGARGNWIGTTDTGEEVQGQGGRYGGLAQTEDEARGQMLMLRLLAPEDIDLTDRVVEMRRQISEPEEDEVEGEGSRYSG